jgi:hypothetical protein
MGKLKPVGSEKLQGTEKIQRMIEISRYKENIPNSLNESSSKEYSIKLSDGVKYEIVKEKNGYVIKKSINEGTQDYLEPIKNRKYYSSYSQAFKRLNLITKEVNTLQGNSNNISLFTEGEEDDVTYVLKTETNEQETQTPAPAPQPAPATEPTPTPMEPVAEPETALPSDEVTSEELPSDDEKETGDEEEVTFKTIQKLTGKLTQKIREFLGKEENKMSSNDIKYVVNSVLSSINLNDLDEDDKEEIIGKFEGGETEETSSDDLSSEEMPSDDMEISGEEISTETPEPPSSGEQNEWNKMKGLSEKETSSVAEMFEEIFSESKIDKVLKKYFVEQPKPTKENIQKIKKLSSNIVQEVVSRKFLEKNPSAKVVGKTTKNNIVMEVKNEKFRITPNGKVL